MCRVKTTKLWLLKLVPINMYNYSNTDKQKDKFYYSKQVQRFPSEECGKVIGLNSIYKNWFLPNGETAESLIQKVLDGPYAVYTDLVKLNLELIELKISDELKNHYLNNMLFVGIGKDIYYHICYGVISKFTIKDIKYYLMRACLTNIEVLEIRNSRKKWFDALKKHNFTIGWASSDDTLIEISKHVGVEYEKFYEGVIKVDENRY